METKPPLPPFTLETAKAKVQAAEDAWNTRDPEKVSLAYTEDKLWSYTDNRISVRFEYEWHDDSGQWSRCYGNEQWEFAESGLMRRREASINDAHIKESERKFRWERKA